MRFIFTTCDKTRKIVEAQKFLFKKYVGQEPEYIDLKDLDVKNWTRNVYVELAKLLIKDELIVFGLDDFLPKEKIDQRAFDDIQMIMWSDNTIDRFELSSCAIGFNRDNLVKKISKRIKPTYLEFTSKSIYSVSTQISVWRTTSLFDLLSKANNSSPWEFEKNFKCKAACYEKPVLSYIEESALSKKWEGKVNVNGLKQIDVQALIDLGYLNEKTLINVS